MFLFQRIPRWISWGVLFFFIFSDLGYSASTSLQIDPFRDHEKLIHSHFDPSIPSKIGRVDFTHSDSGPVVFHIQTAHGNYDAQKNIERILGELYTNYGVENVLVEGTSGGLRPELLKLLPDEENQQLLDRLMRDGLVKGADSFLVQHPFAKGYGVETLSEYVKNRTALKKVMVLASDLTTEIEKVETKLETINQQTLPKKLSAFFDARKKYQNEHLQLEQWGETLAKAALENLNIDVKSPSFQLDWPMLTRFFTVKKLEKHFDPVLYQSEKEKFMGLLSNSFKSEKDIFERFQKMLDAEGASMPFSQLEQESLIEHVISKLPDAFDWAPYRQLQYFLATHLLKDEIQVDVLVQEMALLERDIVESFIVNDEEKQTVSLIESWQIYQGLFFYSLTREDYQRLKTMPLFNEWILQFDRSADLIEVDVDRLQKLYQDSLSFYEGALSRDESMLQNIEGFLKQEKIQKVAIVTGGFHVDAFKEYFQRNHFNYALMTPQMLEVNSQKDEEIYSKQLFQKATLETSSPLLLPREIQAHGSDPSFELELVLRRAFETLRLDNFDDRIQLINQSFHAKAFGYGLIEGDGFKDVNELLESALVQFRSELRASDHDSKKNRKPLPRLNGVVRQKSVSEDSELFKEIRKIQNYVMSAMPGVFARVEKPHITLASRIARQTEILTPEDVQKAIEKDERFYEKLPSGIIAHPDTLRIHATGGLKLNLKIENQEALNHWRRTLGDAKQRNDHYTLLRPIFPLTQDQTEKVKHLLGGYRLKRDIPSMAIDESELIYYEDVTYQKIRRLNSPNQEKVIARRSAVREIIKATPFDRDVAEGSYRENVIQQFRIAMQPYVDQETFDRRWLSAMSDASKTTHSYHFSLGEGNDYAVIEIPVSLGVEGADEKYTEERLLIFRSKGNIVAYGISHLQKGQGYEWSGDEVVFDFHLLEQYREALNASKNALYSAALSILYHRHKPDRFSFFGNTQIKSNVGDSFLTTIFYLKRGFYPPAFKKEADQILGKVLMGERLKRSEVAEFIQKSEEARWILPMQSVDAEVQRSNARLKLETYLKEAELFASGAFTYVLRHPTLKKFVILLRRNEHVLEMVDRTRIIVPQVSSDEERDVYQFLRERKLVPETIYIGKMDMEKMTPAFVDEAHKNLFNGDLKKIKRLKSDGKQRDLEVDVYLQEEGIPLSDYLKKHPEHKGLAATSLAEWTRELWKMGWIDLDAALRNYLVVLNDDGSLNLNDAGLMKLLIHDFGAVMPLGEDENSFLLQTHGDTGIPLGFYFLRNLTAAVRLSNNLFPALDIEGFHRIATAAFDASQAESLNSDGLGARQAYFNVIQESVNQGALHEHIGVIAKQIREVRSELRLPQAPKAKWFVSSAAVTGALFYFRESFSQMLFLTLVIPPILFLGIFSVQFFQWNFNYLRMKSAFAKGLMYFARGSYTHVLKHVNFSNRLILIKRNPLLMIQREAEVIRSPQISEDEEWRVYRKLRKHGMVPQTTYVGKFAMPDISLDVAGVEGEEVFRLDQKKLKELTRGLAQTRTDVSVYLQEEGLSLNQYVRDHPEHKELADQSLAEFTKKLWKLGWIDLDIGRRNYLLQKDSKGNPLRDAKGHFRLKVHDFGAIMPIPEDLESFFKSKHLNSDITRGFFLLRNLTATVKTARILFPRLDLKSFHEISKKADIASESAKKTGIRGQFKEAYLGVISLPEHRQVIEKLSIQVAQEIQKVRSELRVEKITLDHYLQDAIEVFDKDAERFRLPYKTEEREKTSISRRTYQRNLKSVVDYIGQYLEGANRSLDRNQRLEIAVNLEKDRELGIAQYLIYEHLKDPTKQALITRRDVARKLGFDEKTISEVWSQALRKMKNLLKEGHAFVSESEAVRLTLLLDLSLVPEERVLNWIIDLFENNPDRKHFPPLKEWEDSFGKSRSYWYSIQSKLMRQFEKEFESRQRVQPDLYQRLLFARIFHEDPSAGMALVLVNAFLEDRELNQFPFQKEIEKISGIDQAVVSSRMPEVVELLTRMQQARIFAGQLNRQLTTALDEWKKRNSSRRADFLKGFDREKSYALVKEGYFKWMAQQAKTPYAFRADFQSKMKRAKEGDRTVLHEALEGFYRNVQERSMGASVLRNFSDQSHVVSILEEEFKRLTTYRKAGFYELMGMYLKRHYIKDYRRYSKVVRAEKLLLEAFADIGHLRRVGDPQGENLYRELLRNIETLNNRAVETNAGQAQGELHPEKLVGRALRLALENAESSLVRLSQHLSVPRREVSIALQGGLKHGKAYQGALSLLYEQLVKDESFFVEWFEKAYEKEISRLVIKEYFDYLGSDERSPQVDVESAKRKLADLVAGVLKDSDPSSRVMQQYADEVNRKINDFSYQVSESTERSFTERQPLELFYLERLLVLAQFFGDHEIPAMESLRLGGLTYPKWKISARSERNRFYDFVQDVLHKKTIERNRQTFQVLDEILKHYYENGSLPALSEIQEYQSLGTDQSDEVMLRELLPLLRDAGVPVRSDRYELKRYLVSNQRPSVLWRNNTEQLSYYAVWRPGSLSDLDYLGMKVKNIPDFVDAYERRSSRLVSEVSLVAEGQGIRILLKSMDENGVQQIELVRILAEQFLQEFKEVKSVDFQNFIEASDGEFSTVLESFFPERIPQKILDFLEKRGYLAEEVEVVGSYKQGQTFKLREKQGLRRVVAQMLELEGGDWSLLDKTPYAILTPSENGMISLSKIGSFKARYTAKNMERFLGLSPSDVQYLIFKEEQNLVMEVRYWNEAKKEEITLLRFPLDKDGYPQLKGVSKNQKLYSLLPLAEQTDTVSHGLIRVAEATGANGVFYKNLNEVARQLWKEKNIVAIVFPEQDEANLFEGLRVGGWKAYQAELTAQWIDVQKSADEFLGLFLRDASSEELEILALLRTDNEIHYSPITRIKMKQGRPEKTEKLVTVDIRQLLFSQQPERDLRVTEYGSLHFGRSEYSINSFLRALELRREDVRAVIKATARGYDLHLDAPQIPTQIIHLDANYKPLVYPEKANKAWLYTIAKILSLQSERAKEGQAFFRTTFDFYQLLEAKRAGPRRRLQTYEDLLFVLNERNKKAQDSGDAEAAARYANTWQALDQRRDEGGDRALLKAIRKWNRLHEESRIDLGDDDPSYEKRGPAEIWHQYVQGIEEINNDQREKLWFRWTEQEDVQAREELILSFAPRIQSLIGYLPAKFQHYENDLVQTAMLILLSEIKNWSGDVPLTDYVMSAIGKRYRRTGSATSRFSLDARLSADSDESFGGLQADHKAGMPWFDLTNLGEWTEDLLDNFSESDDGVFEDALLGEVSEGLDAKVANQNPDFEEVSPQPSETPADPILDQLQATLRDIVDERERNSGLPVVYYDEKEQLAYELGEWFREKGIFADIDDFDIDDVSIHMVGSLGRLGTAIRGFHDVNLMIVADTYPARAESLLRKIQSYIGGDVDFVARQHGLHLSVGKNGDYDRAVSEGNGFVSTLLRHGVDNPLRGIASIEIIPLRDNPHSMLYHDDQAKSQLERARMRAAFNLSYTDRRWVGSGVNAFLVFQNQQGVADKLAEELKAYADEYDVLQYHQDFLDHSAARIRDYQAKEAEQKRSQKIAVFEGREPYWLTSASDHLHDQGYGLQLEIDEPVFPTSVNSKASFIWVDFQQYLLSLRQTKRGIHFNTWLMEREATKAVVFYHARNAEEILKAYPDLLKTLQKQQKVYFIDEAFDLNLEDSFPMILQNDGHHVEFFISKQAKKRNSKNQVVSVHKTSSADHSSAQVKPKKVKVSLTLDQRMELLREHLQSGRLDEARVQFDIVEPKVKTKGPEVIRKYGPLLEQARVALGKNSRSELRSFNDSPDARYWVGRSLRSLYPGKIVWQPTKSDFKDDPWDKPVEKLAPENDAARQLIEAAYEYLYQRASQEDNKNIMKRLRAMSRYTTIVATEIPTYFYFSNPDEKFADPSRISFSQRTIFFSQKLLDEWGRDIQTLSLRERQIRIRMIALYLNRSLYVLETFYRMEEAGFSVKEIHNKILNLIQEDDFKNKHWIMQDYQEQEINFLIFPLADEDAGTNFLRHAELIDSELPLLRTADELEAALKSAIAGGQSIYNDPELSRENFLDIAKQLEVLALHIDSTGDHQGATKLYRRALDMYHFLQQVDPKAFGPYQIQSQVVAFLLRAGLLDDFLKELKKILSGDGFPSPADPIDGAALDRYGNRAGESLVPGWLLHNGPKLLYALQVYTSILKDPERTTAAEKILAEAEQMMMSYWNHFATTDALSRQTNFDINLKRYRSDQDDGHLPIVGTISQVTTRWTRKLTDDGITHFNVDFLYAERRRLREVRLGTLKFFVKQGEAVVEDYDADVTLKYLSQTRFTNLKRSLVAAALRLAKSANAETFHVYRMGNSRLTTPQSLKALGFVKAEDGHWILSDLQQIPKARLSLRIDAKSRSELRSPDEGFDVENYRQIFYSSSRDETLAKILSDFGFSEEVTVSDQGLMAFNLGPQGRDFLQTVFRNRVGGKTPIFKPTAFVITQSFEQLKGQSSYFSKSQELFNFNFEKVDTEKRIPIAMVFEREDQEGYFTFSLMDLLLSDVVTGDVYTGIMKNFERIISDSLHEQKNDFSEIFDFLFKVYFLAEEHDGRSVEWRSFKTRTPLLFEPNQRPLETLSLEMAGTNTEVFFSPTDQFSLDFQNFLYRLSSSHTDLFKDKNVLEIGVGSGVNLRHLARLGASEVHSSDLYSPYALFSNWNRALALQSKSFSPEVVHEAYAYDGLDLTQDADVIVMNTPAVIRDEEISDNIVRRSRGIPKSMFLKLFDSFKKYMLDHPDAHLLMRIAPSLDSGLTGAGTLDALNAAGNDGALATKMLAADFLDKHPEIEVLDQNKDLYLLRAKRSELRSSPSDVPAGRFAMTDGDFERLFGDVRFKKTLMRILNDLGQFGNYDQADQKDFLAFKLSGQGRHFFEALFQQQDPTEAVSLTTQAKLLTITIDDLQKQFSLTKVGKEKFNILKENTNGQYRLPLGILVSYQGSLKKAYLDLTQLFYAEGLGPMDFTFLDMALQNAYESKLEAAGIKRSDVDEIEMRRFYEDVYRDHKFGGWSYFLSHGINLSQKDDDALQTLSIGSRKPYSEVVFEPHDHYSLDVQSFLSERNDSNPALFKNRRILEIGSGTGVNLHHFKRWGAASVKLVDISDVYGILTNWNRIFSGELHPSELDKNVSIVVQSGIPSDTDVDVIVMNTPQVASVSRLYSKGMGIVTNSRGISKKDFLKLFTEISEYVMHHPDTDVLMRLSAEPDSGLVDTLSEAVIGKMDRYASMELMIQKFLEGYPHIEVVYKKGDLYHLRTKRSELRLDMSDQPKFATLMELRSNILPIRWLSQYEVRDLRQLLTTFFGQAIYSRVLNILPLDKNRVLDLSRETRLSQGVSFDDWLQNIASGTIALDAEWSKRILEETEVLFSFFQNIEKSRVVSKQADRKPRLLLVSENLTEKDVVRTLQRKNKLDWKEQEWLSSEVLSNLSNWIKIISPKDFEQISDSKRLEDAIVVLRMNQNDSSLGQYPFQFLWDSSALHPQDDEWMTYIFLGLMKASSLLKGIPDSSTQIKLFEEVVPKLFPGAQKMGQIFSLDFKKFAEFLLQSQIIDTSA